MTVNFITPTRLSILDITSMGDSSKRGDPTKVGEFDSGFKYAIALLLRSGVKIDVGVYGGKEDRGYWEEDYTETFDFKSYESVCDSTGKKKELIGIDYTKTYEGGDCLSAHDMREPCVEEKSFIKTGFAKALGFNWELWMALREIWSNMLDEGGHVASGPEHLKHYGTIISLVFDTDNPFYEVWQNRHLYINEREPDYKISDRVEAFLNPEGYTRIYKQNILVYENKERPSKFTYNIKYGDIDERRILSNVYSVEENIINAIMTTDNKPFLESIITKDFKVQDKEFLTGRTSYYKASDLANEIANEVYGLHGNVKSYSWLINGIQKRNDCRIKGRKIESVEDSIWTYSNSVSIESEVEEKVTLKDKIESNFNFKVDCILKTATLKGSAVIADKHNKCLILDENFNIENDMSEFFVQYIDLTREGNVVKELGNFIMEILKK